MAEGYNFLEGSQTDINRRLLRRIKELEDSSNSYDDTALKARIKKCEDAIGTYSDDDTIAERLDALETPATEPGG